MTFDWLREIRNGTGKSQEAIAKAVGMGQSGYSMLENGERRPSVETAKKIAAVLGFDWTRFFENVSEESNGYPNCPRCQNEEIQDSKFCKICGLSLPGEDIRTVSK